MHGFTIEDTDDEAEREAGFSQSGCAGSDEDCILNYASGLMKMALLKRNFDDAIKEMDGPRLFRCWKYMILYFKEGGRSKYALEGLYLQAAQHCLLSPEEAYRLMWNRCFNLHGGQGRNIPLDRMVEHNNNQIKEILHNQGANVTFESARKASASIKGVSDILGQLDRTLSICPQSGHSAQVIKD